MTNKERLNKIMNTLKVKAIDIKDKACDYGWKALDWMANNPEAAAAIIVPIAVNSIQYGRSVLVSHREKKQLDRAELTWYDRSTGLRWDLKRKMSNNDRQAITQMKAQGVDTIDILMKLRLI